MKLRIAERLHDSLRRTAPYVDCTGNVSIVENGLDCYSVSSPMPTILLITDDYEATEIWAHGLQQRGIETRISGPEISEDGVPAIHEYDLILIDAYGTGLDAIAAAQTLRAAATRPILLFTYERDERYHLYAYQMGVDECIAKPIGIPLFLAKITVWLRRSRAAVDAISNGHLNITSTPNGFHLNSATRAVTLPTGETIKLTQLELRLLQVLMANRGQVLETERLIDRVWNHNGEGDSGLLKNLVYRLRRKIEPEPSNPRYLQTVEGAGYFLKF